MQLLVGVIMFFSLASAESARTPCYGKDPVLDPAGYRALVEQIWKQCSYGSQVPLSNGEENRRAAKALLLLHDHAAELESLLRAKRTGRARLDAFLRRLDPQSDLTAVAKFALVRVDREIASVQNLIDGVSRLNATAIRTQASGKRERSSDDESADTWARRMLGEDAFQSFWKVMQQKEDLDPYLSWHGAGMGIGLLAKYDSVAASSLWQLNGRCSDTGRIIFEIGQFNDAKLDGMWQRLLKGLDPDRVAELSTKVYKIESRSETTHLKRWKRSSVSYNAATKIITYVAVSRKGVDLSLHINLPDAGSSSPSEQTDAPTEEWNAVRRALGLPLESKTE